VRVLDCASESPTAFPAEDISLGVLSVTIVKCARSVRERATHGRNLKNSPSLGFRQGGGLFLSNFPLPRRGKWNLNRRG
jgi:hypothetical protein